MLGLLLTLAAQGATTFDADQGQAARDFAPLLQRVPGFLASGDVEGAEKLLSECVAAEKRTAAHYLRLGDFFSALDPRFAIAQHAKAFELNPDELQIAQAWATDLERAGRCEEAEPLFARVQSAGRDWLANLQRVDCLVRTGRLEEALEAWRTQRSWPVLPKACRMLSERIASGETREHRRLVLRKAIAAGSAEGSEELVFLDLMRPSSQRRFDVERGELEIDRKLIGSRLDPAGRRARELWAVCDFWAALAERGFPPASAGDFAAQCSPRLRELGWLEAGGELPGEALVLRWATTALLESGLRSPPELLGDWERALAARLEEGEAEAGRALLQIQLAAESPQSDETQALLWTRAHDLEAALTLLERRPERLESGDALLREALARHPGDVRLCAIASDCARREGKAEREALARQIAAGFQAPAGFERVQAAFERLEQLFEAGSGR